MHKLLVDVDMNKKKLTEVGLLCMRQMQSEIQMAVVVVHMLPPVSLPMSVKLVTFVMIYIQPSHVTGVSEPSEYNCCRHTPSHGLSSGALTVIYVVVVQTLPPLIIDYLMCTSISLPCFCST